ncbi:MAG TPA: thiolase family protein [Egibacteraceae bacterium]|nr:thiolase family protein [Egibacteraceae bacterium]
MTASLKDQVAIVGVGETEYRRAHDRPVQELILDAIGTALDDAGLSGSDVDGIVTEGAIVEGLLSIEEVAATIGVRELSYGAKFGIGGAGTVASPLHAAMAVSHGLADVVLCYFGVDWGSAAAGPYGFHEQYPEKRHLEIPHGYFGQPVYFGALTHRYMAEYGLTKEQMGALAVGTRGWARLNPSAMRRDEMTMGDYLASPVVATPLSVADCSLISDGAAAFVMTRADRALDSPAPRILVSGAAYARNNMSPGAALTQDPAYLSTMARVTGPRALRMAEMRIEDIDLFEIYDCFTITCLMQLEDLGLCDKGEIGALVAEAGTGPGGRLPVNTHGGLLSHAYVLGVNHVAEAVHQLRNTAGARQVEARTALVTGYGGPDHCTLILTRG